MSPPPGSNGGAAANQVIAPRIPPRPVRTGAPAVFVVTPRAFFVKFQYKSPFDGGLKPLPKGLLAFLYKGAELLSSPKGVPLDASGQAALKTNAGANGDYHFVLRQPARTYIDLDKGSLAPSAKIVPGDARNLFELPMDLDTAKAHFIHGPVPKLSAGVYKNYSGKGEGSAGSPIAFTLNFAWYPIQFMFWNSVANQFETVPKGLGLHARLNGESYADTLAKGFAAATTLQGGLQRLKLLGYDGGAVDGSEGKKAAAALKNFQSAHGLKDTGAYDAPTQNAVTRVFSHRRVSVFKDGIYHVPLLKTTAPNPKVDFHFTGKETWLHFPTASKPAIFKKMTAGEYDALDVAARLAHYDMPESWTSSGARPRINDDFTTAKTQSEAFAALKCYPAGGTAIDPASPLVYFLDDLVLMKDRTQLEIIPPDTRFTLFDVDCKVVDPDPNAPFYHKADKKKHNYYFPVGSKIFAVFCAGKYYFAGTRRVPEGKAGAGLRAAILNDAIHQKMREPMVTYIGNHHQYYCHGIKLEGKKPVSYLLISWQCHLVQSPNATTPSDIGRVRNGMANYTKHGMTNCKSRHENQGFEAVDVKEKANLTVRLVKHFVAGPAASAFCTVTVHCASDPNDRDNMGLDTASFHVDNYTGPDPDGWFTAAHELGHAMGMADDYIEPPGHWGDPAWQGHRVPRFAQWVKGMPYGEDRSSLMMVNSTIRHRNAFHHVDWVNTNPGIRTLTGNLRFQLKNKTHKFYVPPADERGFLPGTAKYPHYEPVASESGYASGTGRMDLVLYKAGLDETQNVITPKLKFDGILVICIYLKWAFTDGTANWTDATKIARVKTVYQSVADAVNRKYYLKASDSELFKKVLLVSRLHFHEGPDSDDNRTIIPYNPATYIGPHFQITCRNGAVAPSYRDPAFAGTSITVSNTAEPISLFRYLIGRKPMEGSGASAKEIKTVGSSDFAFLASWLDGKLAGSKLGKGYSVKSI